MYPWLKFFFKPLALRAWHGPLWSVEHALRHKTFHRLAHIVPLHSAPDFKMSWQRKSKRNQPVVKERYAMFNAICHRRAVCRLKNARQFCRYNIPILHVRKCRIKRFYKMRPRHFGAGGEGRAKCRGRYKRSSICRSPSVHIRANSPGKKCELLFFCKSVFMAVRGKLAKCRLGSPFTQTIDIVGTKIIFVSRTNFITTLPPEYDRNSLFTALLREE